MASNLNVFNRSVLLLNIYVAKTVTIEEFSKGPPGIGKLFFDLIYRQWEKKKNPTKTETSVHMTANYQLEEKNNNTGPSRHHWSTDTNVQTPIIEVYGIFQNTPFLFKYSKTKVTF